MRKIAHPLLRDLVIKVKGFEGDGDGDSDDDDDDDDGDEGDGDEGKGGDDKDTEGLKSALQKERDTRKKLEKEAKTLRRFKEESERKSKSEGDAAKDDAAKAVARSARLAEGFLEVAVDNAIIKAATVMGFLDLDDALKLVDRELISAEQDEDDPREIDLDAETVKKALDKLAKKKPHLLKGEDDGEGGKTPQPKSGSKFNGGAKSKKEADAAELRRKYPALARGGEAS